MADDADYPSSNKRKYEDDDEHDRKTGFSAASPGLRKSGFSAPLAEQQQERKTGFSGEQYERKSAYSGTPSEQYERKSGFSGPVNQNPELYERKSGFSSTSDQERKTGFSAPPPPAAAPPPPGSGESERKTGFSSGGAPVAVELERKSGFCGPHSSDFDCKTTTGFSSGAPDYYERKTGFSGPSTIGGETERKSGFSASPAIEQPHERKTGFSVPNSDSRNTYNTVPPAALSSIEMAKQRAEQIVARLVSQDSKRPRSDEDSEGQIHGKFESGFDRQDYDGGQMFQEHQLRSHGEDYVRNSYDMQQGFQQSKKMEIPNARVGVVIGKGGETIKYLQHQSGARIQITRDADHDPALPTRQVEIMGTPDQISRAEQMVKDVIAEAESGGPGPFLGSTSSVSSSFGEPIQMKVPTNKVGLIIGRGGDTIKNLQSQSGARIQLVPAQMPDYGQERVITLVGTKQQTDMASDLIREVISESRSRGPVTQQSFRALGPSQWSQPRGPLQSQGYQQQYAGPPQQYQSYGDQSASQPPGGFGPQSLQPTARPSMHQSFGGDYPGQGYSQRAAPGQQAVAPQGYYNQPNQTMTSPNEGSFNQPQGVNPYGPQVHTQGSVTQNPGQPAAQHGQHYNQQHAYSQTSSTQQSYGQPSLNYMPRNFALQPSEHGPVSQQQCYSQQPANQPVYGQGSSFQPGYANQTTSQEDVSTECAPTAPVPTSYVNTQTVYGHSQTPYNQQGSYGPQLSIPPVYGASQQGSTLMYGAQGSGQTPYAAHGSGHPLQTGYAYAHGGLQSHSTYIDDGNSFPQQVSQVSSQHPYNNTQQVNGSSDDKSGNVGNGSFDSNILSSGVPTAQS